MGGGRYGGGCRSRDGDVHDGILPSVLLSGAGVRARIRRVVTVDGAPAPLAYLQSLALANYGHFTTMRVENGGVRGLSLHLDRLRRDCRAVFGADLDPARVVAYVRQAVAGHEAGAVMVRVTVFDPHLDMLDLGAPADPHVMVTLRPAGTTAPPPLRVKLCAFGRDAPAVKHVGLFSQFRLRREAQLTGFDDALFVGPGECVSEGVTWNVGFVDAAGRVVWPEADVLDGVTLQLLRAAEAGSVTAPVPVGDLPRMRAAFATNASVGVRAIRAIDGLTFPDEDEAVVRLGELYGRVPCEAL
ncbi:aminotransferase class IV [Streptomyces morookaense]|uniref:Aminotransferase class IV n=1 Tax=Streptomyces morookaense TaxID=1970 RepID=A0A7Y7BAY3_STRMO|nr:aminotransferase class IV [Streptomyces morookaense]